MWRKRSAYPVAVSATVVRYYRVNTSVCTALALRELINLSQDTGEQLVKGALLEDERSVLHLPQQATVEVVVQKLLDGLLDVGVTDQMHIGVPIHANTIV